MKNVKFWSYLENSNYKELKHYKATGNNVSKLLMIVILALLVNFYRAACNADAV